MKNKKFGEFIKTKAKLYFIDAMSAMAQGLFASLLIGTIFKALGMIPVQGFDVLTQIGAGAQAVAGPAMAVAIAVALKAHPLVVYTCAYVGYLANSFGGAGGPLAVLFIAIAAAEIGMLVSKKTKVDILVTPFVTLFVGGILSIFCAPYIGQLVGLISKLIAFAMTQQPFVMGLIVSVIVGVALTLPISSAAICAALGLSALSPAAIEDPSMAIGLAMAGGAAVAGCCAQMVGFAVMSFKENKWGGLVSQGIGTSMLQMPNIIKNPRIWIPATLTSAITGPLATCVFSMQMYGDAINSGMGTCGLLGPIGIILGWFSGSYPVTVGFMDWLGLALICFILPAVLSLAFSELLYKIGWIKKGDLTLPQ
ncbi:MAG: PTS sugar transporter subunit IIC [Ruminococcaceae bacterium]|nr:PTS sugar transporter subunit IIC [Oscillospiraceae bacterium]